jgi:hypothetical protein
MVTFDESMFYFNMDHKLIWLQPTKRFLKGIDT